MTRNVSTDESLHNIGDGLVRNVLLVEFVELQLIGRGLVAGFFRCKAAITEVK